MVHVIEMLVRYHRLSFHKVCGRMRHSATPCLVQVRFEVLSAGKTLLTPQPRLRTGFFSTLTTASFPPNAIMEACTSAGVAKFGTPLGLCDVTDLKVDMIVVGSSAVSKNGARLGKGEVSDVALGCY